MMQQIRRAKSNRYLNKLAQIEQDLHLEIQAKKDQQINKIKIRCLNPFARTDSTFSPSHSDQKKQKSTLASHHQSFQCIQPSPIPLNPEQPQQSPSAESDHHYYWSEVTDNPLYKSIIVRIGSEYEQGDQNYQYCFSCDEKYESLPQHNCKYPFTNIKAVNQRLSELSSLIEISKCDKFLIIADSVGAAKTSHELILIIKMLKNSSIKNTKFQHFLRKRLINLSGKKVGLLLQQEEEQ